MSVTSEQHLSELSSREQFHARSLEHQKPLSTVTMAFTVLAYVFTVCARGFVTGPPAPLAYRLGCAIALALLVVAIPKARSSALFGAIGVVYTLVLLGGVALNVEGVDEPLLWLVPALVVIAVCAAPLWLTPAHFVIGSAAFYAAAFVLLRGEPRSHDVDVVTWMWVLGIGLPTSVVFHFGFYRFRRNHFLLECQLAQLAATDPLTGLQNRRAFVKQAERRLHEIAPSTRVSAIFLDIDNFKSLNDRFGHAIGDHALYRVAQALMSETDAGDSVSRIGGEEFAVLVHDGLDGALLLAERLRMAIAQIERPDGQLSASFGVAEHRHGETIMLLLDRADEALLRAKHAGRNRVCAERAQPFDTLRLFATDARSADGSVRHRWEDFYLISHFQPLYSLSHQKQVGFEALLRGEQADGALVPPATMFAPKPSSDEGALDRASHAVHLGNACRTLPADAWLFLNILPATFIADGYADQLATIVRTAGLEPGRVILEILESHGGSVDDMSRAAALYREHGFLIAVDDFGAGQSNLDRLLRIRPDLVKLDGELIRATTHGSGQPILPKLVSLLHQAGMLVVVEGVETADELILAVESNVDFAQGYLLGRPAAEPVAPDATHRRIDEAFDRIAQGRAHRHAWFEAEVDPYRSALRVAGGALLAGVSAADAFATLAGYVRTISCFVLDERGRRIGDVVHGPAWRDDAAPLHPVASPRGSRWDHRPYFRNAVLLPGETVTSQPYLSLASGKPRIAVTLALQLADARAVIGVELDWSQAGLPWPARE